MRRTILTAAACVVVLAGLIAGSAGAASHKHPHARAAQAAAITDLRLTASNPQLAACMPHARVKVTDISLVDQLGFDKLKVRARGLAPNRDYTVFLLETAARRSAPLSTSATSPPTRTATRHNTFQAHRRRGVLEHDRQRPARARRPQPGRHVVRRPGRRRLLRRRAGHRRRHAVRRRQRGRRAGVQLGQHPAAARSLNPRPALPARRASAQQLRARRRYESTTAVGVTCRAQPSWRYLPVRTRIAASPAPSAPPMSDSTSSPTMTASPLSTPTPRSAEAKNSGAGLPTTWPRGRWRTRARRRTARVERQSVGRHPEAVLLQRDSSAPSITSRNAWLSGS